MPALNNALSAALLVGLASASPNFGGSSGGFKEDCLTSTLKTTTTPSCKASTVTSTCTSTATITKPVTIVIPTTSTVYSTLPGKTVTLPGSTVTLPGSTVTLPGSTVTAPGSTVTAPGKTITIPGSTITVTQAGATCTPSTIFTTLTNTATVTSTVSTCPNTPTTPVGPVSPSTTTTTTTPSSQPTTPPTTPPTSSTPYTTTSVTTSSESACATTPENGTYCGFINPEDPCAPQPGGYGPTVSPDTPAAFLAYPAFHSMAAGAAATVDGYQQVFSDLQASVSANNYLGLHTLTSYSPSDCANWCDNTTSCTGFNVFAERDPSQNPCNNDSTAPTVWGYNCPNPASITNYQCTLWGSSFDSSMATNTGGHRGAQFQVVIAGSVGYCK